MRMKGVDDMRNGKQASNGRAKWIWYRGDYEIYQNLLTHSRREEQGHYRPSFWQLPVPFPRVNFKKTFVAEGDTVIRVVSNAMGRVVIDRKAPAYGFGEEIAIKKGEHTILVEAAKTSGLPAIYINSEYLKTDCTWLVGNLIEDDIHAGDTPHYFRETDNPEVFPFAYARVDFASERETEGGVLFDFGKELFAKLCISGVTPDAALTVCYGESEDSHN